MIQYKKIDKFQKQMKELEAFIERWVEDEGAEFDKGDIDRIFDIIQFVPGMFRDFLNQAEKVFSALGDFRDDMAEDLGHIL